MQFDYPAIRYGRRMMAGNADYYDVLSKSSDFPDDMEMFFRKYVCQSIQWTCGENINETYPDSFLFWKLPDARFLVARLVDAGCDSRGRPHVISIEALLVKTDNVVNLPVAEFLARLMHTPDWSAGTFLEECGESRYVEEIESYIKSDAESLLLASHPHFQASGIDRLCAPKRSITRHPPPVLMSRPTNPQAESGRIDERRSAKTLVILSILLLLCVTAMIYQGYFLYSFHSVLDDVKQQKEEVEEQLKGKTDTLINQQNQAARDLAEAERYKKQVEDKLAEASKQLAAMRDDFAREKARAERAEGEIRRLRIQLSNMTPDEQIQALIQRNRQYEEAFQDMPDVIKNIMDKALEKVPDVVRNQLHEKIQILRNNTSGEE